jgi:hypothetical protein
MLRERKTDREESSSFLKKRTAKPLRVTAELVRKGRSRNQKFFASFCQERSAFFACSVSPAQ